MFLKFGYAVSEGGTCRKTCEGPVATCNMLVKQAKQNYYDMGGMHRGKEIHGRRLARSPSQSMKPQTVDTFPFWDWTKGGGSTFSMQTGCVSALRHHLHPPFARFPHGAGPAGALRFQRLASRLLDFFCCRFGALLVVILPLHLFQFRALRSKRGSTISFLSRGRQR